MFEGSEGYLLMYTQGATYFIRSSIAEKCGIRDLDWQPEQTENDDRER